MTLNLTAALEAAHRRYAAKRPLSKELFDRASAVLPGGSTRAVLDVSPFAFRVARAHGSRLVDVDGHEYVDFLGDYSAGLLGHDPEVVRSAVTAALDRGWSFGGAHADESRFAEAVCQRFPSIEQVRFTNSGTEANLMAITLARHHTGRSRVCVADGAYHGSLLSFGGGGDLLLAPYPFDRFTYNDPASLAVVGPDTAAVLVEPMMGAAGCIPATEEFLRESRAVCDRTGALLVFDEVMTSRMSAGGAQARLGLLPDMTTLGKYLAGGMSCGAFGASRDLMGAFDPARGGALSHGGTFNNNVVSMAVGAALSSETLSAARLDAHFTVGESLRARLGDVLAASSLPLCVTGMGSLMSIHTVRGPVTRPYDGGDPVLRNLLWHELVERGIYIAGRLYISVSFEIDDADIDHFVAALEDAVGAISHG